MSFLLFEAPAVFFLVFCVCRLKFLRLLLQAEEFELFGRGVIDGARVDVDVALSPVREIVVRLAGGTFQLSESRVDRSQGLLGL